MNTNTTTKTTTATTTTTPAESMDLATIERKALDSLNRSMAKSDLDDLLVGARRSLLLVDCSSSMHARTMGGKRRIDALRTIVTDLRATHPVPLAAFGGNDQVEIVEAPVEPTGGTPLDIAIDFGKEQGANHLVVVTDGEPNSELTAFAAAKRFGGPIDVFFVGDAFTRGAQFAKELAEMTGGTSGVSSLDAPKELTSKIAGLLGDGGAL
jgi:Mg-chelatase subunit ChlD